jgi:parvulin-like peptidyl-prolyl isomerase
MNMKRCLLLICFLASLTVFLPAQAELQPVAIVRLTRSQPIAVKELKAEVATMEAQAGRALTPAERRQVLDAMIDEWLFIQAAERDRVAVSDTEINQQIQQLRTAMAQSLQRQPTDAEFAAAIQQETGRDMSVFREQLRRRLTAQKYLLSKKQSEIQGIRAPTEPEITAYFSTNRTEFTRPETVRLSMIQVAYDTNRAEARTLIDRLAQEIGGNAQKFDEAVIKSQAASSTLGYRGGDAGYIPRNAQAQQLVGQGFVELAFTLRVGEISRVIEIPQGFAIINVTETYPMKILEMDDIFQLGTRLTVHDYIAQGLLQQRQQETLARVQQELVTELRTGNPFQINESFLNW